MKFYKSLSPLAKIYFSTMAFVIYIALIIVPFLMLYSPAKNINKRSCHRVSEVVNERGFALAPWVYLLLFLPALIVYLIAIIKNIGKVEKKRFIVYPTCYIMLFLAFHMLLIPIGPDLLEILICLSCLFIIIWSFGLSIVEIVAIIRDIKGRKLLNKIDKLDVDKLNGKQKEAEYEELEEGKVIQKKNDKKVYKVFYRIFGLIVILCVCLCIIIDLLLIF